MIKTTIGAVLAQEVDAGDDKRIYFIRNENFPIYIGQANYVCERITDHCGLGPRQFQPDQLGDFILNNQPESLKWSVDLLTLDECELIARFCFPNHIHFDIDIIEQALIISFGPCLNTVHNQNNPNRKSIPDLYQKRNLAEQTKKWDKDGYFVSKADHSVDRVVAVEIGLQFDLKSDKNAFSSYRERLSAHTIRSQKKVMERFCEFVTVNNPDNLHDASSVDFFNDPKSWEFVTAKLVTEYVKWLSSRKVAVATLNLNISHIKKYAAIAYQAGIIPEHEWKKISNIKNIYGAKAKKIVVERISQGTPEKGGRKEVFTEITEEQAKNLKSIGKDNAVGRRANLLMCLLLDQGLQFSDLINLRTEQFDLEKGKLHLERPNMGQQVHDLSSDTIDALKKIIDHKDVKIPGQLDFRVSKHGRPYKTALTGPLLYHLIRNIGRTVGIENLNTSSCRAYWIKVAIKSGLSLFDIQVIGGWSDIQSVLRNIQKVESSDDDIE